MDYNMIKDFGLPVFLLLGLLAVLGITGRWLGKNVVVPMVVAHTGLVEDLKQSTKKTGEFIALTAETLQKIEVTGTIKHEELKSLILRECPLLKEVRNEANNSAVIRADGLRK